MRRTLLAALVVVTAGCESRNTRVPEPAAASFEVTLPPEKTVDRETIDPEALLGTWEKVATILEPTILTISRTELRWRLGKDSVAIHFDARYSIHEGNRLVGVSESQLKLTGENFNLGLHHEDYLSCTARMGDEDHLYLSSVSMSGGFNTDMIEGRYVRRKQR